MKQKESRDSKKDKRIVVRVDGSTAEWLESKAESEDCSVGRIIRLALRSAKEHNSFNDPDGQPVRMAA